jgi:hypothetical protein
MTTQTQLALVNPPATDPHADTKRRVRDVIHMVAKERAGYVSMNDVRAVMAASPWGTPPRGVVGNVVGDMARDGRLVEVGTERTTGSTSGNNGRLAPTYRLVTA